jgi:heptosyltransferase-2
MQRNSSRTLLMTESAARAGLLKITPRKRRFVRLFEAALRFLLPVLPSPRSAEGSGVGPRSVLVVEYWNLGDLAILVPFLRNLRRAFPSAHIALLVNAGLGEFLEGQELVDEFIPVRVPWAQHFSRWKKYNPFSGLWLPFFRVLREVRRKKFDIVLSGRMDIRDNFLMWLTGAPRRVGYGIGGGGFLLTDRKVPDLDRPHRSDVWLQLLSAVKGDSFFDAVEDSSSGAKAHNDRQGIMSELKLRPPIDTEAPTGRGSRARFRLRATEEAAAEEYFRTQGIPRGTFLIGVHPGARIAVRRWGDERFAEVALGLLREPDVHVLWFTEPGSATTAPEHERCHVVALEFRAFLAVLARCRLLVCNDSGPMHVANLLEVPVVAVFGSTNPVWFGPRGPRDKVVIRTEMWCRPCFDYCIFDQPYCLRLIEADEVFRTVEEVTRNARDLDRGAVRHVPR